MPLPKDVAGVRLTTAPRCAPATSRIALPEFQGNYGSPSCQQDQLAEPKGLPGRVPVIENSPDVHRPLAICTVERDHGFDNRDQDPQVPTAQRIPTFIAPFIRGHFRTEPNLPSPPLDTPDRVTSIGQTDLVDRPEKAAIPVSRLCQPADQCRLVRPFRPRLQRRIPSFVTIDWWQVFCIRPESPRSH